MGHNRAMKGSDASFAGSIPEVYERELGPVIFAPFADALAAEVARSTPARVLELAAGTGRVTRALAARLPDARIVATDINPPMLAHAATLVKAPNVEWRPADAQALPFESGAFDVVACQFGIMFFPDRPRAFAETRRVLAPRGRFVCNTWGSLATSDFARVVIDALSVRYGEAATRFLSTVPHGYHDSARIRADLSAGGLGEVNVEERTLPSRAASARGVATGFCEGTPMRHDLEATHPGHLAEAIDVATAALERAFGAGPIEGSMRAWMITAERDPA
jgi:SAM-dependent methyltransferase